MSLGAGWFSPTGMITIYGIKSCDVMKKARDWLKAHEVEVTFHDYKTAGIDEEQLSAWAKRVGWTTLLNTKGTTFQDLPEWDRKDLSEAKAIRLMAAAPSMIKRPVLDLGNRMIVGFKPAIYEEAFGIEAEDDD